MDEVVNELNDEELMDEVVDGLDDEEVMDKVVDELLLEHNNNYLLWVTNKFFQKSFSSCTSFEMYIIGLTYI